MKFTCQQQILAKALNTVSKAVSSKTTIPSLKGILIEAKEIEKCREDLYRILSTNCNQPYEKVFADADRNYWMTADEALAYGMVDNVIKK